MRDSRLVLVWQALDLAFHAADLRSTSNVQNEITKLADQLAPCQSTSDLPSWPEAPEVVKPKNKTSIRKETE